MWFYGTETHRVESVQVSLSVLTEMSMRNLSHLGYSKSEEVLLISGSINGPGHLPFVSVDATSSSKWALKRHLRKV